MMSSVVVATHNAKKGREMVHILSEAFPNLRIRTLAEFPGAPEPEETGTTYEENALLKAQSAAQFTGELCIADDAGLEIDALNGEPGLYSKRFGGEDLPFPDKMKLILERMAEIPEEGRAARFRAWVAVAHPSGEARTFEGVCEGRIAKAPRGEGGFGYDPIFYLEELDCTMAQLSPEEKHAISHRGKVLALVKAYLSALLG